MGFKHTILGRLFSGLRRMPCLATATVVLCSALVAACGQKGALYLPTEPAARDRATLPQVLVPLRGSSVATPTPAETPTPPASAASAAP